jgi:hypothetical protein
MWNLCWGMFPGTGLCRSILICAVSHTNKCTCLQRPWLARQSALASTYLVSPGISRDLQRRTFVKLHLVQWQCCRLALWKYSVRTPVAGIRRHVWTCQKLMSLVAALSEFRYRLHWRQQTLTGSLVSVLCDALALLASGSLMMTLSPVTSGFCTVTLVLLLRYCFFGAVTSLVLLWYCYFGSVTLELLLW